jgi:tetratricopeptide (TPR) repeat protein
MGAGEVSAYWRDKGVEEILADPGAWIRLALRKLRLFLSNFEYGVLYIPEVERFLSVPLALQILPAGLLLALGLPGLYLALKRKHQNLGPLLLFLSSSLATVLLFFMASRFRLPFMAGLLPFAGYFAAWIMESARSKRFGNMVLSIATVAAITAVSHLLVDRDIRSNQLRRAQITLSKALLDQGEPDQARAVAMKAHGLGVTPAVLYQLGLIEEAVGNGIEAELRFEDASRMDPFYLEPLGGLAALYEGRKDWARALEMRQRIIDLVPHRFEAHFNMGLTCADAGDPEGAVLHLKKAVSLAPGHFASWEVLGKAYRLAKEPQKALEAFRKAQEIDPVRGRALEEAIRELRSEGSK